MSRSLYANLARRYRSREIPAAVRARQADAAVAEVERFYPLVLRDQAGLLQNRGRPSSRVAVVGGGLAGLSAAWWLQNHGFSVELFEASGTIGGRVRSISDTTLGRVVEHGAELIGRDHSNWLRFARRFSLPLSLITDAQTYAAMKLTSPLLIAGQPVDPERTFEELDRALTALNHDAARVNPFGPWTAARAREFDDRSVADWVDGLDEVSPQSRMALRFQLENMQAISVDHQSYLGLLAPVASGLKHTDDPRHEPSAYWDDSEVYRCAVGNQELARALAASIPNDRLHCEAVVDALESHNDGVTVSVHGTAPRTFDWVVVAVPPGSLPNCSSIPNRWRAPLGAAAKFEMRVRSRFWLTTGLAPTGSSDAIGLLWEGTDNQNLPPESPAQLTLFLGGRPAVDACAAKDPEAFCLARLAPLYPDLARHFISGAFVNWPATEHVGGGYSCPRVGDVLGVVKPMRDGIERMTFAGEHTAMPFFGYMEGALQSGIRAAHAIAAKSGVEEAATLAEVRSADSKMRAAQPGSA